MDFTIIGHCPKCFKKFRNLTERHILSVVKNRKLIKPAHVQLICPDCGVVLDEEDYAVFLEKEFTAHAIHVGRPEEIERYKQGLWKIKRESDNKDLQ